MIFQFSKIMEPQSRRTAKTAENYFAGWVAWFTSILKHAILGDVESQIQVQKGKVGVR